MGCRRADAHGPTGSGHRGDKRLQQVFPVGKTVHGHSVAEAVAKKKKGKMHGMWNLLVLHTAHTWVCKPGVESAVVHEKNLLVT